MPSLQTCFVSLSDAQSHFTENNLLDKCSVASNFLFLSYFICTGSHFVHNVFHHKRLPPMCTPHNLGYQNRSHKVNDADVQLFILIIAQDCVDKLVSSRMYKLRK